MFAQCRMCYPVYAAGGHPKLAPAPRLSPAPLLPHAVSPAALPALVLRPGPGAPPATWPPGAAAEYCNHSS